MYIMILTLRVQAPLVDELRFCGSVHFNSFIWLFNYSVDYERKSVC